MTNLELMICEAENAGEIDLDTRDIMLGILNESTAQARRSRDLNKRINELYDQIEKLENQEWKYRWRKDNEMADKLDSKISKLEQEADRLSEKAANTDGYGNANRSYYYGRIKNIDKGREAASKNPYRSTGKCTKESVLEEIYEAELCGDITSEERATLIDCMDI